MNRSRLVAFILSVLVFSLANSAPAAAQAPRSSDSKASGVNMNADLKEFMETPGISGYENKLAETIRSKISGLHPKTDNLGDVIVTIGTGAPSRLIVTPIDEPGFVVSGITDDGYLRVQRLPQGGLPPIFNELYSAQPVKIETTAGKWIDGVVAGLSVHLQGGRANPPKSSDLENVYIDIGATSVAQVRKSGVDILSPVAIDREAGSLGYGKMAGASIGDRFGAAAVVDLLRGIDQSKIKGTLTIAFVVQQWTGARGLQRVLSTMKPDEMIYVGRLFPGGPVAGMEGVRRAPRREPGSGVLIGMEETNGTLAGLTADLKQLADSNKIQIDTDFSASLLPRSYLAGPPMPAKWAHLGIATDWPNTPAELIDISDLANLENLLQLYVQGNLAVAPKPLRIASAADGGYPNHPSNIDILNFLVPSYGVSGH